jgi:serine/threonine-protein kinase
MGEGQVSDPLIGRRLGGRFEIVAPLGRGGMASVYRGRDANIGREVAVKVLGAPGEDAESAERFLREARTLAALKHPNIVRVYDYGEDGALRYIVQELLPGPNLQEELADLTARRGTLPLTAVAQVAAQVAAALDYAHARGVIHRDLKPANLIRNQAGEVVLADFGIAKVADSGAVTRTGYVMGTPSYLSPEQAGGARQVTPASDIYALGVVLFELLTGATPFEAPTPVGVVIAHIQQPPPAPSSLRPGLTQAVDAVVLRALAKSPADRFPSAGALAQALAQAIRQPPGPPAQRPSDQPTLVAPPPRRPPPDGAPRQPPGPPAPRPMADRRLPPSSAPAAPAGPRRAADPAAQPSLASQRYTPPARRGEGCVRNISIAAMVVAAAAILGLFLMWRLSPTPQPLPTATPGLPTPADPVAPPVIPPTELPPVPTPEPVPVTVAPEPPSPEPPATPEPPTLTPEPPTATVAPPTLTPEPPTATIEPPTVAPEVTAEPYPAP